MIEDGEESSMTIAASPDDGTNVKERVHAAANMLELMSVHKTPLNIDRLCTFSTVFHIFKN